MHLKKAQIDAYEELYNKIKNLADKMNRTEYGLTQNNSILMIRKKLWKKMIK